MTSPKNPATGQNPIFVSASFDQPVGLPEKLDVLVAGITDENRHKTAESDKPVGQEVW